MTPKAIRKNFVKTRKYLLTLQSQIDALTKLLKIMEDDNQRLLQRIQKLEGSKGVDEFLKGFRK